VADHPYSVVIDKDRRYSFTDIPPETYRVTVLHPYLRESYINTVTIMLKGQAVLDITVAASTGRPYANQPDGGEPVHPLLPYRRFVGADRAYPGKAELSINQEKSIWSVRAGDSGIVFYRIEAVAVHH
jgi:hypothetical protein